MPDSLPAPIRAPDAGPYWDAANEERLVMQRCTGCNLFRFIPRLTCPSCGSEQVNWDDVSGKAVIHSLTTVHRGPTDAFRANAPYVLALVDLAEGPRMMANIVGVGADQAKIGDAVSVCFEIREGGTKVPQFSLVRGDL